MKKADIVDSIAGKIGVPKAQVQQMVDDVFDLIADALARRDKIDLRGFGTFSVRDSKARTGRNPQSGEPIQIPARTVPTFKPGKELKDKVNTSAPPAEQAS